VPEVHAPTSLGEALEIRSADPDACPIAGGTDLMVELNFDRARPPQVLDLTRVRELTGWAPENGRLRIGSGVLAGANTRTGSPAAAITSPKCDRSGMQISLRFAMQRKESGQ